MLFFIFVGIALVAIILWINRYSLIEGQVRKELSKAGIEAAFDIKSVNRTGSILNNLQLSDEDGPFLSADQLAIAYTFKQARAGIVDKITLKNPVLRVTLDGSGSGSGSGNVIDRWVPEASENSEPITVPKDGIFIENGLVNWAPPWGAGATGINAHIQYETHWQSQIDMRSARFVQGDVEFDYSFAGNIDRMSEHEMAINGEINLPFALVREARTGPVKSDFNLKLSTEIDSATVDVAGKFDVEVFGGVFPAFAMENGNLDIELDAQFNTENGAFDQFRADWNFNGNGLSVTDPQMRERLVRRTMSYEVLVKTPIAMYFADYFLSNGAGLLKEFSANGGGSYLHTPSGYALDFDRPLILQTLDQHVSLQPGRRSKLFTKLITERSQSTWVWIGKEEETYISKTLNLKGLAKTALSSPASIKFPLKSKARKRGTAT